jgi:hypothetical protein
MAENISFNFGAIRDTITRLSSAELIREHKSVTLDKFLSEIKKSPILTKQQFVFKNIETAKPFTKERLAERFIAQNMQLFKNEKWNNITTENKRVRKELLDDMHIESRVDNKLAESINTLIEFNSNSIQSDFGKGIEREIEAYDYVIKHLTRSVNESDYSKEKEDNPKLNESWKFITKVAVNNFNDRYEHLNEEEKKVFSVLVADEKTKIAYLNELRQQNLKTLSQILETKSDIDSDAKELLENFKSKLINMQNVNFVNIDEYILSNLELQSYISE